MFLLFFSGVDSAGSDRIEWHKWDGGRLCPPPLSCFNCENAAQAQTQSCNCNCKLPFFSALRGFHSFEYSHFTIYGLVVYAKNSATHEDTIIFTQGSPHSGPGTGMGMHLTEFLCIKKEMTSSRPCINLGDPKIHETRVPIWEIFCHSEIVPSCTYL